ncbi:MAG: HGGxSTG domain-containing protein [Alphaproteobacteria bacterium]|nr:HGGxSTG domain-containing protein [Alphaproteobacteria bacterium]
MRWKKKCCARTRRGTRCQCKALPNGRCKLHGGLSTGPQTVAGRARIAAAQKQRWRRWRELNKRNTLGAFAT